MSFRMSVGRMAARATNAIPVIAYTKKNRERGNNNKQINKRMSRTNDSG